MKLQDQVCTLEQAKELKELGVIQESFFAWYGGFEGSKVEPVVDLTDQRMYDGGGVNGWYGHPDNTFSAFTVGELGLLLGNEDYKSSFIQHRKGNVLLCSLYYNKIHYSTFYTEAEARAQLLIDLIKAKVKHVDVINERLKVEQSINS